MKAQLENVTTLLRQTEHERDGLREQGVSVVQEQASQTHELNERLQQALMELDAEQQNTISLV